MKMNEMLELVSRVSNARQMFVDLGLVEYIDDKLRAVGLPKLADTKYKKFVSRTVDLLFETDFVQKLLEIYKECASETA